MKQKRCKGEAKTMQMRSLCIVNKSYLSHELYLYGIQDIRRFLRGRGKLTNIGDSWSSSLFNKRGIPQGSIFGLLLFLIFISNLCNSSQSFKCCMYADDTSLLCSSINIYEHFVEVNIDLGKINLCLVAH